jgi:hypothetical protein
MEKNILPSSGKKCTGVISKAMPSLNKGSTEIVLGELIHINLGKHFSGHAFLCMLN